MLAGAAQRVYAMSLCAEQSYGVLPLGDLLAQTQKRSPTALACCLRAPAPLARRCRNPTTQLPPIGWQRNAAYL